MPTADTLDRPVAGHGVEPAGERPKAVLTCPRCGHESPVDGDWTEVRHEGWIVISCPDCGAHLTSRPDA